MEEKEFWEKISEFEKRENRGSYYPMFIKMIEKGFQTEAFLFILSTWNFAIFRYAMKDFDLKNFEDKVEELKPIFAKFKTESLEKINFDKYKNEIKEIFDTLSKIKGIQFTGTSKLMHLTNPSVFIMWDGYIRKAYGFKKGDFEDYFNFLKLMQKEFKDFKSPRNRTLAKCIDEYNYLKFTIPALEKNRNKRKSIKKNS